MRKFILFLFSHGVVFVAGIALGIYLLPILTAPESPDAAQLQAEASKATYKGEFTKDLKGSDFLHWGEGTISVGPEMIVHQGELSPGPDYKLYLTNSFVEDEAGFEAMKDKAALVGDIKTFGGFKVAVPNSINIENYTTVIVWCESFGEFITAAKYR